MIDIDKLLRPIVKKAIYEKWSFSELEHEIQNQLSYQYSEQNFDNILEHSDDFGNIKLSFDFLKTNTIDYTDKRTLTDLMNFSKDFAQQKSGLNNAILNSVQQSLKDNLDASDAVNDLLPIFGKYQNQAETVIRTAYSGLSSLQFKLESEKAGIDRFLYNGPPPERPICRRYWHRILTMNEIKVISEQIGYDFFIYRGYWNCRHWWDVVV